MSPIVYLAKMDTGIRKHGKDGSIDNKRKLWKSKFKVCPACQQRAIESEYITFGGRMNGDGYGTTLYTCKKCDWSTDFPWDEGGDGPADELSAQFRKEEEMEEDAKDGDPEAIAYMGELFYESRQKGKSDPSLETRLKSCLLNSKRKETAFYLGYFYEHGLGGLVKDEKKAYECYVDYMSQHYAKHQRVAAWFSIQYLFQVGTVTEMNKAIHLLYTISEQDSFAKSLIGAVSFNPNEFTPMPALLGRQVIDISNAQVISWYQKMVDAKMAAGYTLLGQVLYHGALGVDKNVELALSYFNECLKVDTQSKQTFYEFYLAGAKYYLGLVALERQDQQQGIKWIQVAGAYWPDAIYKYGLLLKDGLWVSKDLEKARSLLEKAYRLENVDAGYELALMLEQGIGGKPNLNVAALFFERMCAESTPSPLRLLALLGHARIVLKTKNLGNPEKCVANLESIKDQLPQAFILLAEYYIREKKYDLGYQAFKSALDKNLNQACFPLFELLNEHSSKMTIQDSAVVYLEKAAETGHALAAKLYARALEEGQYGLERNDLKALEYYKKATAYGLEQAEKDIQRLQLKSRAQDGHQSKADYKTLLLRAAKAKDVQAMYDLGVYYLESQERSMMDAVMWLTQAATLDYAPAREKLDGLMGQKDGLGQFATPQEKGYWSRTRENDSSGSIH